MGARSSPTTEERGTLHRLFAVTAVAVVAAAASAVWAFADSPGGSPTVTGCLAANGDLRDVAVGAAPLKSCKDTETQVQLAGPRPVTNYTVFRRVPFQITALSPTPPQTVMTLALPAGKYVVSTHVLAFGSADGYAHIRCTTSPSVGAPSSGLILTDLNVGNRNGSTGAGTLSGTSPEIVAEGATIQLSCRSLPGSFGTPPTVAWAVITATPIDGMVVQEDTTTS